MMITFGALLATAPIAVSSFVLERPASDDGQRVFVHDAAGELSEIPVSPGQTNVSAQIPAHFATSDTLRLRVD
jgi:hypothetical protein